jgi:hypothetical protein
MIDFIKSFFDLKKGSLFLVFTSYLAFNFRTIFLEDSFTLIDITLLILSLIIIEVIFKLISLKNPRVSLIIIGNIFFFLFGYFIVLYFQKNLNQLFELKLRGRIIFIILYATINILLILNDKPKYFKIINTFFIVFIILGLFNTFFKINSPKVNTDYFTNRYIHFQASNKDKPVLLIITDEYHSPDDLFKYFKDSSIYNFSNKLGNKGWKVNNKFITNEASTNNSISSLFNYNLSNNKLFKKLTIKELDNKFFKKNQLFDSLLSKNIKIGNLGIFDFGNIEPKYRVFKTNQSFLDRVFEFTSIKIAMSNTENFNKNALGVNFYPTDKINRFVFYKFNGLKNLNRNTFIYSHLLMPHTPFLYDNEFKFKKTTTINYLEFWKFTNDKLEFIIEEIIKSNDIKIILSGDHGYRYESKLNPKFTFLALYGFDDININEIKTVQDLGSLINSNF